MVLVLIEEVVMGLEEAKDALTQAAATLGELAEELPPNLRHPGKDVIETKLLQPLEQRATRLPTVLIRRYLSGDGFLSTVNKYLIFRELNDRFKA
jgi:hypothetical protein